jgi:hypothetical protein
LSIKTHLRVVKSIWISYNDCNDLNTVHMENNVNYILQRSQVQSTLSSNTDNC